MDIDNGDLINNNFIITIDNASDLNSIKNITEDDDEYFDTNYVDDSIALASNYSKSLNDIRITHENVPMRPNSLAIRTDDHFMYSNTNNNDNTKCFINDNDVSTSNSKQQKISFNKHFAIIARNKRDLIFISKFLL